MIETHATTAEAITREYEDYWHTQLPHEHIDGVAFEDMKRVASDVVSEVEYSVDCLPILVIHAEGPGEPVINLLFLTQKEANKDLLEQVFRWVDDEIDRRALDKFHKA